MAFHQTLIGAGGNANASQFDFSARKGAHTALARERDQAFGNAENSIGLLDVFGIEVTAHGEGLHGISRFARIGLGTLDNRSHRIARRQGDNAGCIGMNSRPIVHNAETRIGQCLSVIHLGIGIGDDFGEFGVLDDMEACTPIDDIVDDSVGGIYFVAGNRSLVISCFGTGTALNDHIEIIDGQPTRTPGNTRIVKGMGLSIVLDGFVG